MKVTLEGGKKYQPKPDDPVTCEDHGVTVLWKDLDAIQKLAVSESIDTDSRCILLPRSKDRNADDLQEEDNG